MADKSTIEAVNDLVNKIKKDGMSEKLAKLFINCADTAIHNDKDLEYGLKIARLGKGMINQHILQDVGADFFKVAEVCRQNNASYAFADITWDIMLLEAPYLLDSFWLYIEKNKPAKTQLYLPRRRTLKRVVDKLQDLEDDKLDVLFVHQPPRTGKLLADDTEVLTKNGWKTHGELKLGDEVVGSDGKFTKVTCVHPKHHTTHTVVLSNGERIECHENHEWTVYDRNSQRYVVRETKEMLKNGVLTKDKNRCRYMLPIIEPMIGEKKDLHIHPYALGAWLGDGTNTKPWLNNDKKDLAIIDKMISLGYDKRKEYVHKTTGVISSVFGRKFQDGLQHYGMCYYNRKTEKHIPDEFFSASLEQRLELLAGLLDTDGTLCKKEHRYHYSTISKRLCDDIVRLVSTFGWRACVTVAEPHTSSFGIVGKNDCYVISFNPTLEIPTVLERKHLTEFSKQRRIGIKEIVASENKPGNCISVENEDGLYAVGRTMQLTHNSLCMTVGNAWHCARNTEGSNLYVTYKESLGGSFVNGVNEIYTDPTYCFADVFPNVKVVNTDAKNHKLDLNRKKKYWSLSGKGLESGLNGEYDCYGWFTCDDLLEGIQDAMNPETLHRKQTVFNNNALSRPKENAKEIYNGTIWSLKDIFSTRLDFLLNDPSAKGKRVEVLKLPALNDKDESNFDYDYGVGYSTKYYLMKRATFEAADDLASWCAQYQQEPIERDGAVFNKDNMHFYNGELPAEEPLKVVAACDVALGGKDYLACPLAYVYEDGSVYIHDVVFDNNEKNITEPQVVEMLIRNECKSAFFESNQGGEGYKDDIDRLLKEQGHRCNLVSRYAPTNKRKEQRIWDNAPNIREFYFRDVGCRSGQYSKFMTNLYSFTINGKNKYDDAPDSLSSLCDFIYKGSGVRAARVMKSMF